MVKHSNTLLITLFFVALVLSITTTYMNINQISIFYLSTNPLTGAASFSFGQTNLTINAVTSLSLAGANGTVLNFGSGYVNATCDAFVMDSNNINISLYSNGSILGGAQGKCGVGFTSVSSGFLIENTGNQNISVGYTCSGNCTFSSFIGGTRYGTNGLDIKITQNVDAGQAGEEGGTDVAASCQGGGTYYRDSAWNITNATTYTIAPFGFGTGIYTAFAPSTSGNGHYLCGNSSHFPLASDNTRDAAVVDFNITIPANAPATSVRSSFTITFNGTSS